MEENNPIRVRLSTVILCFIIFILIVVIAFMYFYFSNQINSQQNSISNNNSTIQSSKTNSTITQVSSTEYLDINGTLVKKLYEYIPANDTNVILPNAYQDKKITKDSLGTKYLLEYAFGKLDLKDTDKTPLLDDGKPLDGWYSFDADLLQEKVKELFGTTLENMDFDCGAGAGCTYSNGRYSFTSGGGSGEGIDNLRTIKKAYKDDNYLYIEDNYLALISTLESIKIYKTSIAQNPIGEITDNRSQIQTLEEYTAKLEKLKSEYSDQMTSYKHTFKKNTDGSYYWYSTEPIV